MLWFVWMASTVKPPILNLSPALIRERAEMEQMYSNEIGNLLFSAYESREGLNGPAWKAIKGILGHDMQFKETKQEWFVKLFCSYP